MQLPNSGLRSRSQTRSESPVPLSTNGGSWCQNCGDTRSRKFSSTEKHAGGEIKNAKQRSADQVFTGLLQRGFPLILPRRGASQSGKLCTSDDPALCVRGNFLSFRPADNVCLEAQMTDRHRGWKRVSHSTMTHITGARVIRYADERDGGAPRYYLEGAPGSHDPVSGGRKTLGVYPTFAAAATAAESFLKF
jgi:hypothetical protein